MRRMSGGRRDAIGRLGGRESLVGYLLWQGGKWYFKQRLRSKRAALMRRLPSRRRSLVIGVGGLAAVCTTVLVARRLAG